MTVEDIQSRVSVEVDCERSEAINRENKTGHVYDRRAEEVLQTNVNLPSRNVTQKERKQNVPFSRKVGSLFTYKITKKGGLW
jgi:hypothetical protein